MLKERAVIGYGKAQGHRLISWILALVASFGVAKKDAANFHKQSAVLADSLYNHSGAERSAIGMHLEQCCLTTHVF